MTEKPRKRGRPAANPELNADQKKMANELGVSLRTVQRWAGTHQEIMSDPDLVHMTETLEGYQKANIPVNVSARLMGHEVQGQTFGNYSDGLALQGLREAINHVDWSSH